MPAKEQLRRALRAAGLEPRAVALKRAFEPAHTTQDRRDHEALPDGYAPALIKIDVEGAELGVLRGARATLAAHHPLVAFEHGLGSADHYGTGPDDVHDLLTGLGYRIFDLQGSGPYDRTAFARAFHTASRVNFLARP